mmetsp:Transcript_36947/g.95800  ORF Transcript_36947/g.95800 Transcript_36947/m.95800 type:complete len:229 (+) Transcript_36947:375-1061(+)
MLNLLSTLVSAFSRFKEGILKLTIHDILPRPVGCAKSARVYMKLLDIFDKYAGEIKNVYRYYSTLGISTMDGVFAMSLSQFKRFVRECRCAKVSQEVTDQIFLMANVERGSDGSVVQDEDNPDRKLTLIEFVEAVVRVGHVQYIDMAELPARVEHLIKAKMLGHAGRLVVNDNIRNVLHDQAIERVFRRCDTKLKKIYSFFAAADKTRIVRFCCADVSHVHSIFSKEL